MKRICRVGVSRAGYYRHLATGEARASRRAEEERTVTEIRAIHAEHRSAYGAPRVHAELRARGRKINRKGVTRLMRVNDIVGRHLRKKKRTTIPDTVGDYVATLAVHPYAGGAEVRWSAAYRGTGEVVPQVEALFGDGTYGTGLDALRMLFARE